MVRILYDDYKRIKESCSVRDFVSVPIDRYFCITAIPHVSYIHKRILNEHGFKKPFHLLESLRIIMENKTFLKLNNIDPVSELASHMEDIGIPTGVSVNCDIYL